MIGINHGHPDILKPGEPQAAFHGVGIQPADRGVKRNPAKDSDRLNPVFIGPLLEILLDDGDAGDGGRKPGLENHSPHPGPAVVKGNLVLKEEPVKGIGSAVRMAVDAPLEQLFHIRCRIFDPGHEAGVLNVDKLKLLADQEILYLFGQVGDVKANQLFNPFDPFRVDPDGKDLFKRHIFLEHGTSFSLNELSFLPAFAGDRRSVACSPAKTPVRPEA